MKHKCRYCETEDNLQKNRNICKKCHAEQNKIWWNSLSTEEKQKRNKVNYRKSRKKIENTSNDNIDYCIRKWIQTWKNRSGKTFQSRKDLDSEGLFKLAKQGLEKFTYMDFSINKKTKKAFWASVDKIDPSKDYSDINNLQFIPYWLNSAKLDLTIAELQHYMNNYLNS